MQLAAANIRAVAEAELAASFPVDVELAEGQRIRLIDSPVAAAGVYAPGGRAVYPSSVLMCCVPARVAGVGRIAVASPPGARRKRASGACSPRVPVAGVDEVYAMGGAQAIAALALGTESVAAGGHRRRARQPLRRRGEAAALGPGRHRRQSRVRPSWSSLADDTAEPDWVALDLCAQAEHGDGRAAGRDLAAGRCFSNGSRRGCRDRRGAPQRRPTPPWPSSRRPDPDAAPGARRRAGARAPRAAARGRRRGARPRIGSPDASSSGPVAARRSGTTPPGRTTSCRPAAPPASAGRSGRARSCGAPRSSSTRPWRPRRWRPRSTRSRARRAFPSTASRPRRASRRE